MPTQRRAKMASEKGNFAWKNLKAEKNKRLRCMRCNNPLLLVISQPVARQAKTLMAHHSRVIAKCPICKRHQRITLGGAK
jgi:uncharacterized protein with PIN domain